MNKIKEIADRFFLLLHIFLSPFSRFFFLHLFSPFFHVLIPPNDILSYAGKSVISKILKFFLFPSVSMRLF